MTYDADTQDIFATVDAVDTAEFEVMSDTPFFAPVSSDLVDGLIGRYQAERSAIVEVATFAASDRYQGALHYFISGNVEENSRTTSIVASKLFEADGAIAALNATYWSKALALTDVLDMMPQKRRTEWHESIREQKTPDFEEATVRATLMELLNMRQQFLAERIDGIFQGLSSEHLTNTPEGFNKRMIINYVHTVGFGGFISTNYTKTGLINDLRCVIAKFMGRDEPNHRASDYLMRVLQDRYGEWVSVDGGALRIKLHKKGTAHMEINPDMAWRLNAMLASLHPLAIPSQFRKRPTKKAKEFALVERPLPFAVLSELGTQQHGRNRDPNTFHLSYECKKNAAVYAETVQVLVMLGGVPDANGVTFTFEYDPSTVLQEVIITGCVPDTHSHQFFATPEVVGRAAVDMAEIEDNDSVLEPSAGHGDLAAFLPIERTTCVEVAALRCSVLRARGFNVQQADFIQWAAKCATRYSKVVMNPPFSEQRWQAHLEAASRLLTDDGRLVAILPGSAVNKTIPGFDVEWSRPFTNEFAGTSVSVVIGCFTRQ